MKRGLTRRDLLQSSAAGALLAPFFPLLDARAAATPKRLLFFVTMNGTVREKWLPTMNGGELVLSDILSPLESYKSEMLVVDGLRYKAGEAVQGGHEGGVISALTGTVAKRIDSSSTTNVHAQGISIDQAVANAIGVGTKLKSVQCGVRVFQYSAASGSFSWTGPGQYLSAKNSPYDVYKDLFSNFMPPQDLAAKAAAEQKTKDRRGMLDFVKGDLDALKTKLDAAEKQKLEAHLQSISDIESALFTSSGAAALDKCMNPDLGTPIDPSANDNMPQTGKLHMNLLVAALACDLTRVATLQFGRTGAEGHYFSWLGKEFLTDPNFQAGVDEVRGYHSIAHNETNPTSRTMLVKINNWYAGQLAYLWGLLKNVPEGNGTMADNTLIVWMNEMGTGNHSLKNTPWVLLGRLGGAFKTGRVVSFPDTSHSKILVNLGQAYGLPIQTFGAPEFCDGPLAGLA